jgi:hypothetical protein
MKAVETEPKEERARAEIDRLLHSDLFRASDAQRRLLSYLAEKSLSGQADELKEYTVGTEGMGKPPDYDPQRDSSVRMQAARLRDKLTEFYQTEGANDPIQIEFPKGRFKLLFELRSVPARISSRPSLRRVRWITAMAMAILVAILVWAGGPLQPRISFLAGGSSQSAVDTIWQPFFTSKRPVLLSLGAPLFMDVEGLGYFRAPGTDDWDAAQRQGQLRGIQQLFPGHPLEPTHVYTGIGEATGAFHLAKLFGKRGQNLRLVPSDMLSWEEIAGSDVIFVGPPKFNLQLKEIPVEQDIILDRDGIRNLHPHADEPPYIPDEDAPRPVTSSISQAYALITRMPGLHGEGDVIVCASNWTVGTLAAILYVTREDSAQQLVDRMRLPSGKLPRYYQVVVRSKVKGFTPLDVSYVFHHELKPSH